MKTLHSYKMNARIFLDDNLPDGILHELSSTANFQDKIHARFEDETKLMQLGILEGWAGAYF